MAGWGKCRQCTSRIWWGTSPYDPSRAFPFDDSDEQQSHFETCSAQDWVVDPNGDRHRTSTCRMCHARVWWDTTPLGRRRPMDCEGGVATWTCHLDTCIGVPTSQSSSTSTAPSEPEPSTDPVFVHMAALELTWPFTTTDVESAYRRLARVHHPDMGGEASAFMRIKDARDWLKTQFNAGALV